MLLLPFILATWQGVDRPRLEPVDYRLAITIDFPTEVLHGRARLAVVNGDQTPASEVSLLLYRMLRMETAGDAENRSLPFSQAIVSFDDFPQLQVNQVLVRLPRPLQPGDSTVVTLEYAGYLAGYAETGMLYVQDRIDPAFTILRTDAFAYPEVGYPSRSANSGWANRSFHYEIQVTVPDSLRVANGGRLVGVARREGQATYVYRDIRPAWRLDIAIAPYQELVRGGSKVFYLPADSTGARRVLRAVRGSLALFRDWFGPLVGDTGFSVIEIPNGWGSQTDRTAIIQAAAAFQDSTRVREVYHEVSHLWNAPSTDSAPARWNEGLATFLESAAAVALDSAEDHLVPDMVNRLRSWYARRPEHAGVAMIDYGRHQITGLSYSTGAVMFYLLERVVGREEFKRIIGGFYRQFARSGATTQEFAEYAAAAGGMPACAVLNEWLLGVAGWRKLGAGEDPGSMVGRYRQAANCRLGAGDAFGLPGR